MYKLIKQYPGSPELGTIAKLAGIGSIEFTTPRGRTYTESSSARNLFNEVIKNQPVFWDEVIEKDYEILSFSQDSGITDIWTKFYPDSWGRNVNGQCATIPYTTEEILSNKLYAIHSVKRLSDGEVFTIGDNTKDGYISEIQITDKFTGGVAFSIGPKMKISLWSIEKGVQKDYEILSYIKKGSKTCTTTKRRGGDKHDEFWNIHSVKRILDGEIFTVGDQFNAGNGIRTIESFKIEDSGDLIITHEYGVISNDKKSGTFHLAKKVPVNDTVLFTTNDGVDIYLYDTIYIVYKDRKDITHFPVYGWRPTMSPDAFCFSTKKLAKEFIKKHTILFTADDGIEIFHGDAVYYVYGDYSYGDIPYVQPHNETPEQVNAKKFASLIAAKNYVVENKPALSVKEFWYITYMQTSDFNKNTYMENLVKERLNLK